MYKLDSENAEEWDIKLPTFFKSWRKQGNLRKTSASASLATQRPLTVWITANCRKFLELGIPDHLTFPCMHVKKQHLELNMEQQTGSNLTSGYIKVVYFHSAYLMSMQRTSSEIPGKMNHKLESRLPGEISAISDMQMTPPLWQKVKRN